MDSYRYFSYVCHVYYKYITSHVNRNEDFYFDTVVFAKPFTIKYGQHDNHELHAYFTLYSELTGAKMARPYYMVGLNPNGFSVKLMIKAEWVLDARLIVNSLGKFNKEQKLLAIESSCKWYDVMGHEL